MKKAKKAPRAERAYTNGISTTWKVQFPSTAKKPGAFYWATTYQNSDLVYVTTGITQNPVFGAKLIPAIKAAIKEKIASELNLACGSSTGKSTAPNVVDVSGLKALFDAVPPTGPID